MYFRGLLLILSLFAASLALGSHRARVTAQTHVPADMNTDLIERLVNLAPVLDSRRSDMRSFSVRWHVGNPSFGSLRAICAYAPPDQRACTVTHDEVPLFIAVGQDIFVYGPLHGPRLLRGDWRVSNEGKTPGELAVNWHILSPGNPQAGIDLDLRSLVTRADRDRSITRLGEDRFLLTGRTASGGVLQAWIDSSTPGRYSRLTARSVDDTVGLEVDSLVVDGQIRPEFLRFPSFQGKLNLGPATPIRIDNIGELVQQALLSSFLRGPLKYPGMRKQWEESMAQPPDWQRLEAEDAVWAPILSEIVKGTGHP
jgi:hypothetical protein